MQQFQTFELNLKILLTFSAAIFSDILIPTYITYYMYNLLYFIILQQITVLMSLKKKKKKNQNVQVGLILLFATYL